MFCFVTWLYYEMLIFLKTKNVETSEVGDPLLHGLFTVPMPHIRPVEFQSS